MGGTGAAHHTFEVTGWEGRLVGMGLPCLRPLMPQVSRARESRRADLLWFPRDGRGLDDLRVLVVLKKGFVLRECVLYVVDSILFLS